MHVQSLVEESGRRDLSLAALHHDSHEAFIGDFVDTLKRILAGAATTYEQIAERLDRGNADAFGFRVPEGDDRALIKTADQHAFRVEVEDRCQL